MSNIVCLTPPGEELYTITYRYPVPQDGKRLGIEVTGGEVIEITSWDGNTTVFIVVRHWAGSDIACLADGMTQYEVHAVACSYHNESGCPTELILGAGTEAQIQTELGWFTLVHHPHEIPC